MCYVFSPSSSHELNSILVHLPKTTHAWKLNFSWTHCFLTCLQQKGDEANLETAKFFCEEKTRPPQPFWNRRGLCHVVKDIYNFLKLAASLALKINGGDLQKHRKNPSSQWSDLSVTPPMSDYQDGFICGFWLHFFILEMKQI